jgi:hypothetical protein
MTIIPASPSLRDPHEHEDDVARTCPNDLPHVCQALAVA